MARSFPKNQYAPFFLAAAISWAAFSMVVWKMLPPLDGASKIGIILFYLSLFFALTSSFTLIVCFSRRLILGQTETSIFNAAIRQAVLLSILAVGSLLLLSAGILNWWSGLLFVAAIVLAELYFSSIS